MPCKRSRLGVASTLRGFRRLASLQEAFRTLDFSQHRAFQLRKLLILRLGCRRSGRLLILLEDLLDLQASPAPREGGAPPSHRPSTPASAPAGRLSAGSWHRSSTFEAPNSDKFTSLTRNQKRWIRISALKGIRKASTKALSPSPGTIRCAGHTALQTHAWA